MFTRWFFILASLIKREVDWIPKIYTVKVLDHSWNGPYSLQENHEIETNFIDKK